MLDRSPSPARRRLVAFAAVACALVLPAPASAALGDLDGTYGAGGVATLGGQSLDVTDGVLDSSGRAVLAGTANGQAVVARVRPDGSGFEWFTPLPDLASSVAVAEAPNGRLVVAGSGAEVFVRRVSATDGGVEDWGGSFPADLFGGSDAVIRDVAVRPSGEVLAAGWTVHPRILFDEFLLAAFDQLGQRDTAFGAGGYALAGDGVANWHAHALVLGAQGRATLTGDTGGSAGIPVARFTSTGAVEGTPATVPGTGAADQALALALLPADRLLLAGIAYGQSQSALLARLNADLAPDGTFGSGGIARFAEGLAFTSIAMDPAGGLHAAGYDQERALLAKVDDRGRFDPTLGAAGARPGLVAVDAVTGPDRALGLGIDSAGRAHLIGVSEPQQAPRGPLATRHQPNAAPSAAFTGPFELQPGQEGAFDAIASSDPERALRRYEWDFDGDGAFETDAGTNPAITRTFGTTGVFAVGLRVTDHGGLQSTAARPLRVAAPPAGPKPRLGRTAVLSAAKGRVRVRLPGTRRFVPISDAREIPNGTEIDARKGRARITVARNATGALDTSDFYLGRFRFRQASGPAPYTTLSLAGGDFRGCGPANPKLAVAAAKGKRRVVRRLWGDGHGRFRTKGRYASATVRGTRWQTIDRCDGVALVVTRGVVSFRDLLRGRPSRRVAAGQTGFVASKKRRSA